MKQSEIKDLSINELGEKLKTEKAAMVKLKMNHAVSPVENPMKIREARKTIARLSTALRAAQISESAKK
jgi:large subunit ribosomal protein L29